MPLLPSGRRVGVVSGPLFEMVKQGDWGTNQQIAAYLYSPQDLAPLLSITYYKPATEPGGSEESYLSNLMLADIGTQKCDWPAEDVEVFQDWLASELMQQWLKNTFEKLQFALDFTYTEWPGIK